MLQTMDSASLMNITNTKGVQFFVSVRVDSIRLDLAVNIMFSCTKCLAISTACVSNHGITATIPTFVCLLHAQVHVYDVSKCVFFVVLDGYIHRTNVLQRFVYLIVWYRLLFDASSHFGKNESAEGLHTRTVSLRIMYMTYCFTCVACFFCWCQRQSLIF